MHVIAVDILNYNCLILDPGLILLDPGLTVRDPGIADPRSHILDFRRMKIEHVVGSGDRQSLIGHFGLQYLETRDQITLSSESWMRIRG